MTPIVFVGCPRLRVRLVVEPGDSFAHPGLGRGRDPGLTVHDGGYSLDGVSPAQFSVDRKWPAAKAVSWQSGHAEASSRPRRLDHKLGNGLLDHHVARRCVEFKEMRRRKMCVEGGSIGVDLIEENVGLACGDREEDIEAETLGFGLERGRRIGADQLEETVPAVGLDLERNSDCEAVRSPTAVEAPRYRPAGSSSSFPAASIGATARPDAAAS